MPGHKGGAGAPRRGIELFGEAVYEADVSEMGGFDYLHGASSALVIAQSDAAAIFSADKTFFLVNGATAGNLAAILSVCTDDDEVLVARGSHRSVYAALVLSGAKPHYLAPMLNRELDGLFGVDPRDIATALETNPRIKAVHVTSPSYYGFTLPISEIAAITASFGVPLIVDEAHGSHFAFHPEFPSPALLDGADAVVQSPHKTLGSLTQSSLLHLRGDRIDESRIAQNLQMLQSSSPSALLLVSLNLAIAEMAANGTERWEGAIHRANRVRDAVNEISGLVVYGSETVGTPGIAGLDPTKLVVDVAGLNTTGQTAAAWLKSEWHINPEFSDLRRIIFSITTGDEDEHITLLIRALRALSNASSTLFQSEDVVRLWPKEPPPMRLSPRDGFNSPQETVAFEDVVDRIAAEMIIPYPPGIPLLVPGEVATKAVLDTFRQLLDARCRMVGMADPTGRSIRCVVEGDR
jgi:arginine decarboxylase